MKNSKAHDADYKPPKRAAKTLRNNNSAKVTISHDDTLLNKEAELIWEMHKNRAPYPAIASTICTKHKLPATAITGKQVNNWVSYRKKSGQGKTNPVTSGNLAANDGDNCMLL